jgi:hypothetical protein
MDQLLHRHEPAEALFPSLDGYPSRSVLQMNARLWPDADLTASHVISRLVGLRVANKLSRNSMDDVIAFVNWMVPGAERGLPPNAKSIDRVVDWATSGVVDIIPVCVNGCVLFRDSSDLLPAHFPLVKLAKHKRCPVCYAPRFLGQTKTPQKVVMHFPLGKGLASVLRQPEMAASLRRSQCCSDPAAHSWSDITASAGYAECIATDKYPPTLIRYS